MEKGTTIWLVGLSASGKSTLAQKIMQYMDQTGQKAQLIDGDIMREEIGGMFGYERADRIKVANIYRAMAKLLNDNGINVVVAAISPYEEIRQKNRQRIENFIEISLECSIEECINRDPKGLYKKALAGKEKNVIGIDAEFEKPQNSDLTINTHEEDIDASYKRIINLIELKEQLKGTIDEPIMTESEKKFNKNIQIFFEGLELDLKINKRKGIFSELEDEENTLIEYSYTCKCNDKNQAIKDYKSIAKLLLNAGYTLKVLKTHIELKTENVERVINISAYTKENEKIILSEMEVNEVYWEQYYLNIKRQKPSSFCSFINDFLKEKYFVIDIGCGSARDSFEFSRQNHDVIGLDRSEQAISFANAIIKEEKYTDIYFENVDISNKKIMADIFEEVKTEANKKGRKVMYYSRFFLHSIDEIAQTNLLNSIAEHISEGDIFVAEFRTREDQDRQKIYSDHYRRFVDEEELINQAKRICGLNKLKLFQKGTGFSVYKDEDPYLARVILEK